jgi:hypothetical protein
MLEASKRRFALIVPQASERESKRASTMHAVCRVCNMRRQGSCMSDWLLFLIAFKRRLPYVEGSPRKKKKKTEKFAAGKIIYHM